MMNKILAIIALLFLPTLAAADTEYVVRPESTGACYLGDEHQSSARVCSKCLEDSGNAVVRAFRVFCKGSDSDEFLKTEKLVTMSLDCDDSEQELKDDDWWRQEANEDMENRLSLIPSEQCDLSDNWGLLSTRNILGAGAVALAFGIAFVAAGDDESDKPKYTIKKKEGNSRECRSGNKRLHTGADLCHNCEKSDGDTIAEKYDVYCNGNLMGEQVTGILKCTKYIRSDESKQKQLLRKDAEKKLRKKSASWNRCEAR